MSKKLIHPQGCPGQRLCDAPEAMPNTPAPGRRSGASQSVSPGHPALVMLLIALSLTLLVPRAHAASPGEYSTPEIIPLDPAQREELRRLVATDPEAAAIAEAAREKAAPLIGREPSPLRVIHYQGLLNTDPRRVESVEHLRQLADAAHLLRHWQLSGDPAAAETLRELIAAWADTYEITGNDVNENKLVPLLVAYHDLRPTFADAQRQRVDAWVRRLGEAHRQEVERSDDFSNRYTKHVRLLALAGLILDRPEWVAEAHEGVRRFVTGALRPDGTSADLEQRDSLDYHGSALEPPLELAMLAGPEGHALYRWESPAGGSLKKSVDYLVPYSTGEKQHAEWVDTRSELDRQRAAEGIEKYRAGKLYDPMEGLDVMEAASYFDTSLLPVVRQMTGSEAVRFPTWRLLINAAMTVAPGASATQPGATLPPRHPDWPERGGPAGNPIVTGPHGDEGPAGRFDTPYHPITYGRDTLAPLPNLSYSFALHDWDGDGLTDILANLRRGGGIVFYKNIGTVEQPLFWPLHENAVLLRHDWIGRFFDVIDVDGDGKAELAAFAGQEEMGESVTRLGVFYNDGSADDPEGPRWRYEAVVTPEGEPLQAVPDHWHSVRVRAADWDGDGRDDLILGWDRTEEIVPGIQDNKGDRIGRWRSRDEVNTDVGRVLVSYNRTEPDGPPTFTEPQELEADGEPLRVHHFPSPHAHDMNGDGRLDLVVGVNPPRQVVYLRQADGSLKKAGPMSDGAGEPIATTLAIQGDFGDLTGDGLSDFVGSSYFGNANRFMLYEAVAQSAKPQAAFRDRGALSIQAHADTPVYAMGNSTIDPVDFDGDGDHDLLLGAERGTPTVAINVGSDEWPAYDPPARLKFVDGSPWESYAIETGEGSHWGVGEWYSDRVTPRGVDWDGDGTLDLISGSMGRRIYFSKGVTVDGELRFERPVNLRHGGEELAVPDRTMPAVLDWNGDGTLDLIIPYDPGDTRDPGPDAGQLRVYPGIAGRPLELGEPTTLMRGDGTPLRLQDVWGRVKGNRSSVAVHDWDGDGHRDLIVTMFHRGAYLAVNRGDDTFEDWQTLVPDLYTHNPGVSVFDYDRDGVADLLLGGDERRMIEPALPAHLVYIRGQDTAVPPGR